MINNDCPDESLVGKKPHFEPTTHGKKQKLFLNGFSYLQERQVKEKTYWKCARYWISKCPKRLQTRDGIIIKESHSHSHSGDARDLEKTRLISKLKCKALTSSDSRRKIVSRITALPMSKSVVAVMPSAKSLMDTVGRVRSRHNSKVNFISAEELEIEKKYALTSNGLPFLIYDSEIIPTNVYDPWYV